MSNNFPEAFELNLYHILLRANTNSEMLAIFITQTSLIIENTT